MMGKDAKTHLELHKETVSSWIFSVTAHVGTKTHTFLITVDKAHFKELTDGKGVPLLLAQESFFFLLEREPVEAILKEFNLHDITTYFPEYESVIKKVFGVSE